MRWGGGTHFINKRIANVRRIPLLAAAFPMPALSISLATAAQCRVALARRLVGEQRCLVVRRHAEGVA